VHRGDERLCRSLSLFSYVFSGRKNVKKCFFYRRLVTEEKEKEKEEKRKKKKERGAERADHPAAQGVVSAAWREPDWREGGYNLGTLPCASLNLIKLIFLTRLCSLRQSGQVRQSCLSCIKLLRFGSVFQFR
jgi:hypothetical protein